MPRRTALIIAVPEAEPAVGAIRLEHDPSAALGAPAHITILFPFGAPATVDEEAIAEVLAPFEAFSFELDRVERFPEGPVWLHPEPSEPFVALTHAFATRWRDYPPYGGAFEKVIPHLTLSIEPIEVQLALPIGCVARAVTLLEEDDEQHWRVRRRFPLQPVA